MGRARALVVLALACAMAMVGVVVYGASTYSTVTTETTQDVMRAERFELMDSQGRVRAVLGMIEPAAAVTSFRIMDRDGNEIVVPRDQVVVEGAPVRGGGEAPGISLFDEAGRPRARMWLGPDGTPYLEMTQADGTVILALPSEGRVKMLAR